MAKAGATSSDASIFRNAAIGASSHAAFAIRRGCDRPRSILIAFCRGGLRTRQTHGSAAALRRQSGYRQQRRDNNAQNKTHDAPLFDFHVNA
jgi:hypothetical protein